MAEKKEPTLNKINNLEYACSECDLRIQRNIAGPKRTERQWRNEREKDFREHVHRYHPKK